MNLPNKITLARILMVPIFLIFIVPIPNILMESSIVAGIHGQLASINDFIMKNGNYVAAIFFIIAASTDGVDGYIARKRKEITKLGIFLDPIADKILIASALIAMVERGMVSSWVAVIIISREFIVTGLRLVAAGEGIVISAGKWGKIKMVVQIIAISALLLNNFPVSLVSGFRLDQIIMALAVLVTIYSGYDYVKRNLNTIVAESPKQ